MPETIAAPPAAANTPAPPAAAGTPAPAPAPASPTPAPAAPAAPTSLLGAATAEPKTGADAPAAPSGAPEKYADFTLPEGMTLDASLLEKASATFKKQGLTQEYAQELVTLQAESSKAGIEAVVKTAQAQRDAFLQQEKAATLQALGPEPQKELAYAAKAFDKFGSPTLRKMLDESGFGMNLEMARFAIAVGRAMAEDTMPGASRVGPQNDEQSMLDRAFPSMRKEGGSARK